jgi:hypothetical protein
MEGWPTPLHQWSGLSSDGSHRFDFDRQDLRAVLQHDGSAVGSIRGEDLRKNRKFFCDGLYGSTRNEE